MRRKVQERMVVFPSGELSLEGLYHKGNASPAIVVGSPHPRYGGSMDSPVVAEVAFGAARERHPTLRFNYRGVGASQGARAQAALAPPGDCIDVGAGPGLPELADYRAALEELRATAGVREVVAAGYSFGAALALAAALSDAEIVGVVLVSPPTKMFDVSRGKELRVPVLVAAGTEDTWLDWRELEAAFDGAPAVRFEKIPDAGHVFDRGLVALSRTITDFMAKLAPG